MSYNNEGLMSIDTIKNIMKKYGKYSLMEMDYTRFRADKGMNRKLQKLISQQSICIILEKIK